MPIAITDEHQELASTVRGVLTAHKALQAARTLLESDDEPRPSYWGEMADLGWLGIHLPEAYGGSGAGLVELVVVLDELGRQVAPGPVPAHRARLRGDRPVRRGRAAPAPAARAGRRHHHGRPRPGHAGPRWHGGHARPATPASSSAVPSAELLLLRVGDDVVVVEPRRPVSP